MSGSDRIKHPDDRERGKRLKLFRTVHYSNESVSLREFAKLISKKGYDISFRGLLHWENGSSIPCRGLAALYKLGCNLNWLLTGNGDIKHN